MIFRILVQNDWKLLKVWHKVEESRGWIIGCWRPTKIYSALKLFVRTTIRRCTLGKYKAWVVIAWSALGVAQMWRVGALFGDGQQKEGKKKNTSRNVVREICIPSTDRDTWSLSKTVYYNIERRTRIFESWSVYSYYFENYKHFNQRPIMNVNIF